MIDEKLIQGAGGGGKGGGGSSRTPTEEDDSLGQNNLSASLTCFVRVRLRG